MTRQKLFSAIVLGLVAVTGTLVLLPADAREVPLVAPLASVPLVLNGWTGRDGHSVLPVDEGAQESLSRTYWSGSSTMWISIGYYPLQADGRRPAVHALLHPIGLWSQWSERTVHLTLSEKPSASIQASLVVMRAGERELAVLYWYQVGPRSIASGHWYRLVLLYNRVVRRRAEGALVRIASPIPEGATPEAVLVKQTEFLQTFYPDLLRSFSR